MQKHNTACWSLWTLGALFVELISAQTTTTTITTITTTTAAAATYREYDFQNVIGLTDTQPILKPTDAPSAHIQYSTVSGYFLQDDDSIDPDGFDFTAVDFGLIKRNYDASHNHHTQWQRFTNEVARLQANSPDHVNYKVLFLGRHGDGQHNRAERWYGSMLWDCYFSSLDGNGTTKWADADLSDDGIRQAIHASDFWRHELEVQKIPAPQSYYSSPLQRCLHTAGLTFSRLEDILPPSRPFSPVIKEKLREGISIHTCDRRSDKTHIHKVWPGFSFEDGFTEHDELWDPIMAETPYGQDIRSKSVLDDIFSSDRNTWLSITSHSGEIASLLRVLGHRPFPLATGAVIPVLVKAETLSASSTTSYSTSGATRSPSAVCTDADITSIDEGCICWNDQTQAPTGTDGIVWPTPTRITMPPF